MEHKDASFTGVFYFDPSDRIYNDHFPGNSVVPGSLVIGAFITILEQKKVLPTQYELKNFRFRSFLPPGEHSYEIIIRDNRCKCILYKKEKKAVTGEVGL